ncbi:MAG TPA: ribonuclease HII [Candidatus Dormibacteraeota bacterium]|nr:ribonuclease HII [Candidatus Dormibacteraeota bacterium]
MASGVARRARSTGVQPETRGPAPGRRPSLGSPPPRPARGASALTPTSNASDRRHPAGWYRLRLEPDHAEERWLRSRGYRFVAGIDEVGRGCLAGPVVAGAVILPSGWAPEGLRDSKLLKPEERERLDIEIRARAVAWAVAAVEPGVIDRINILQATLLATQLAASRLAVRPDVLVFDGSLGLPEIRLPQRVIVDADRLCASVAAASVVAKVARDRLMVEYDVAYPGYGLASNKGYAAPEHRAALVERGLTPIHRRTFASVAAVDQLGFWEADQPLSRDDDGPDDDGGGVTED